MLSSIGYRVWQLQHVANRCGKDPSGQVNDRSLVANQAWIALDPLLWTLIIAGMLLSE